MSQSDSRCSEGADPVRGADGDPGDEHCDPSCRFELPTFATGGSMTVGEAGSRVVMFRVSPGESIHVRTPAQVRAARRPWYRRFWSWLTGRRA